MAFDVSTFQSALNFGGARPSLFEFFITSAPVQAAEDAIGWLQEGADNPKKVKEKG